MTRLFDTIIRVNYECAESTEVSMIQMLDFETGIELKLESNGKSYKEYDFLNGKLRKYIPEKMTNAQWLLMRKHQVLWVGVTMQANLYLALHRRYGFGAERIWRLMQQICEIENSYDGSAEKIRRAAKEETGIDVSEAFCLEPGY